MDSRIRLAEEPNLVKSLCWNEDDMQTYHVQRREKRFLLVGLGVTVTGLLADVSRCLDADTVTDVDICRSRSISSAILVSISSCMSLCTVYTWQLHVLHTQQSCQQHLLFSFTFIFLIFHRSATPDWHVEGGTVLDRSVHSPVMKLLNVTFRKQLKTLRCKLTQLVGGARAWNDQLSGSGGQRLGHTSWQQTWAVAGASLSTSLGWVVFLVSFSHLQNILSLKKLAPTLMTGTWNVETHKVSLRNIRGHLEKPD